MEIIHILNTILMSIAVSLGVGCSTVAITQFIVAIKDGQIGPAERNMLGAVYTLLRVAMAAILVTILIQVGFFYYLVGDWSFVSPFMMSLWTVVGVLFLNAAGMTMHWIPSKIGPAIQASSWYTLGVLMSLITLGLISFAYTQFILVYAGLILLTIASLNLFMNHLKDRRS